MFTMYDYQEDIVAEAPSDFDGKDVTPAVNELFSVDKTHRKLDAACFGQRNQVLTCRREALSKPQPLGNRHLRFVLVLAAGCASGSQPTRTGKQTTLLRAPSPLNTSH